MLVIKNYKGAIALSERDKNNDIKCHGSRLFTVDKYGFHEKIKVDRKIFEKKEKEELDDEKLLPSSSARKKRLMNRIYAFVNLSISRKYLNFTTFTFPEQCSNRQRKKIWNTFLTRLRKRNRALMYIWVSEEHKSGLIHYHCLFNCYVKIDVWLAIWTETVYNESKCMCSKGAIDVKSVRGNQMSKVAFYISKYLTKGVDNDENFVWACDRITVNLFSSIVVDYRHVKKKILKEITIVTRDRELIYYLLDFQWQMEIDQLLIYYNDIVYHHLITSGLITDEVDIDYRDKLYDDDCI